MPIQTVGKQNYIDGKPIEAGTVSHAEASRAAKEHGLKVAAGRTTTVAFEPSVGVELFFGKSAFADYVETPQPEEALAAALRTATAEGADATTLAAIAAKPAQEHAADAARTVSAKQMKESFRHGGQLYASGHWIVQTPEGVEVVADADFGQRFKKASKPKAAAPKPSEGGQA